MELGSAICFGDIIQLRAKSAFEDGAPVTLSFLEQQGKDQPLLVLPPAGSPADAKLVEAEFIIASVRGEKPQAAGTPLTYKTPFTLCTTEMDKKSGKEVAYSLNNKVAGHKDGVTLQPAHVKGEMYLTLDKPETVAETTVHEHDAEFQLVVVDSNRIRKSLNQPLGHFTKPKTSGAFVGCSVAKGSKALSFSMTKLQREDNKTRPFMKEAKMRRASIEALEPAKMDELGRPDRIDSDASEMEARSRNASLVGMSSASPLVILAPPTATPSTAEATTSDSPSVSEPVDRSEREAEHSAAVLTETATTLLEPPAASNEAIKVVKAPAAPVVEALPTEATTEETKTVEKPVTPAETKPSTAASTADVVISEAFTAVSEAPAAATMTTMSSTAIEAEELDAEVANDRAMCVGGAKCSVM